MPISPARTPLLMPVVVAVCCGALLGCSDDASSTPDAAPTTPASSTTPSQTPSETPSQTPSETPSETPDETAVLSVSISGDQVLPNAEEISLETGEKLRIEIESDRAGELHVHSRPEQYVEFDAGRTQQQLTFDTPGSVEVEEHESGAVVAIIEVR